MAAQSTWIEFQIHFSIERTREVALYNHASESLLTPDFYFGAELFALIKFNRATVSVFAAAPGDEHASARNRQCTKFSRVRRELMECEAQILGCFRFDCDCGPFHRNLTRAIEVCTKLRADEFTE